ncbi:MAG: class I SAM-dependent methyltransferase [Acidobacteriota bacterium]|nr:MAG: class I SAM-dependent methyltransferase [Acidobacteriota bacterium]
MNMSRLEKWFVNRERKAARNFERVRQRLGELRIDETRDVLEIGSGTGGVAARLAEIYRMTVTGTDFDRAQIELARRLHPETERLRFRVEDAAALSFADESFDLVVSQNVFHHIPDWSRAVAEIRRVLRPHGHLIWLDLTFPRFVKKLLQPIARGYGLYTADEIRGAFRLAGFETRFAERLIHGPLVHHHLVLQRPRR